MSGDEGDFNNTKNRAVFKLLHARQWAEGNSRLSDRNNRDSATWYATVINCVARIKRVDFSTCVAPRPGRNKTLNTPRSIDQIHELILEYRRISSKSIAEKLDNSRERFGYIIHEDLNMEDLSAKWVYNCLNADQIHQKCQFSEQILEFFRCYKLISCRYGWPWKKICLYYYETEWRPQSKEWRHSGPPQKIPEEKFAGKFTPWILGSTRDPPNW